MDSLRLYNKTELEVVVDEETSEVVELKFYEELEEMKLYKVEQEVEL